MTTLHDTTTPTTTTITSKKRPRKNEYHAISECELASFHPPQSDNDPPPSTIHTTTTASTTSTNSTSYWQQVYTLYSNSTGILLANTLEWLDFGILGYSATQVSAELFHGNTEIGWMLFGIGFVVRPWGAYGFGKVSDTYSRKASFLCSLFCMAGSTALLALLPPYCPGTIWQSYCVSKLWQSAVPAVLLRIVQGLAAGGACGGVNVIQSELYSTPFRSRILTQSVGVNNLSGAGASVVAASVVLSLQYLLGTASYRLYGWRLAFLLVIPPTILASLLTQHTVPESNEYCVAQHTSSCTPPPPQQQDDDDDNHSSSSGGAVVPMPGRGVHHTRTGWPEKTTDSTTTPMWQVISVSIFIQFAIAAYNNLNVYMVQFAREQYGASETGATAMILLSKLTQMLFTLPAAACGDKQGWFGTAALGGTLCAALALPMMCASVWAGLWGCWILVGVVEPAVATYWILTAPLLATSIFPVQTRSQWTGMVLATGVAVAGFFPLVLDQLDSMYLSGTVLALVAAMGSGGILWIRHCAKNGRVRIYQRPELY